MRHPLLRSALLATSALVLGQACKSPAVAPAPARTTDDAEARARAEAEARRRAEEEARRKREEQERAERARLADGEKLKAFQKAAEAALQDIHFAYDRSEIRQEDRAALQRMAEFLRAYPQAVVQIEGHCDERGTIEYNIALGDRRAHSALDYLAALGAARERFSTISYGKERPLCTEPSEPCWSRNRRAHFHLKN